MITWPSPDKKPLFCNLQLQELKLKIYNSSSSETKNAGKTAVSSWHSKGIFGARHLHGFTVKGVFAHGGGRKKNPTESCSFDQVGSKRKDIENTKNRIVSAVRTSKFLEATMNVLKACWFRFFFKLNSWILDALYLRYSIQYLKSLTKSWHMLIQSGRLIRNRWDFVFLEALWYAHVCTGLQFIIGVLNWTYHSQIRQTSGNTIERCSMHGCNKVLCMYLILGWKSLVLRIPWWNSWILDKAIVASCVKPPPCWNLLELGMVEVVTGTNLIN